MQAGRDGRRPGGPDQDRLFDPGPYLSSVVLIRAPSNASRSQQEPACLDPFGTGFFIESSGVVLTALHNVTEDGQPDGRLLPWV